MYVDKFAFLFILVVEHYKTFQLFVTIVFRGGGGSKRKLRELNFLSDIDILMSPLTKIFLTPELMQNLKHMFLCILFVKIM